MVNGAVHGLNDSLVTDANSDSSTDEQPPIQAVLTLINRLGSFNLTGTFYSVLICNLPLVNVDEIEKLITANARVNISPKASLELVSNEGMHDGCCILSVSDLNVAVNLIRCLNGLIYNGHTLEARFITPLYAGAFVLNDWSWDLCNWVEVDEMDGPHESKSCRVFIGNVPFYAKFSYLKDFMVKTFGAEAMPKICRVVVPLKSELQMPNPSVVPLCTKGFVLITMVEEKDAKAIISKLNGMAFMGRKLVVRYDRFPFYRPNGMWTRSFQWRHEQPPVTYTYRINGHFGRIYKGKQIVKNHREANYEPNGYCTPKS